MKSTSKKNIINAVSILALGAILSGGGIFLWQNQFTFNFTPQASTQDLQSVVLLGEKSNLSTDNYGQGVVDVLATKTPRTIEFIDQAEVHPPIASPRDQAVLAYNAMNRPIEGHVYFLLVLGKNAWIEGLEQQETIATTTASIRKQVTDLVELLAARPGAFPQGFTIFLAAFPDPLKGTGDAQHCGSDFPIREAKTIAETYKEITRTIEALSVLYPEYIEVVPVNNAFSAHTLLDTESWFSDCVNLNAVGEQELSKRFLQVIEVANR
ncbi:MAG: hypothetical protein QY312_01045 [Candidatus Dojkabacteria bacterium]|nr:MAG: hypothetical protein QY312_01045 [Candidatus Dojkabacteria bacterium]